MATEVLPKKSELFKVGDTVVDLEKNRHVKIIFGPFNKAYNYYFEVEDERGKVYTVNMKRLSNKMI
jgi:transcription antitermination factor NusG